MATVAQNIANCVLVLLFVGIVACDTAEDEADNVVYSAGNNQQPVFVQAQKPRYLLYEVNPGEGFNLRRDVYMRVANMIKFMNEDSPWVLVLPPWGPLYHWKSKIQQRAVPWANFFDLDSLREHVPVMEFADFVKLHKEPVGIDEIFYLQRYAEGWTDGKWSHRVDVRDCMESTGFNKADDGRWVWHFWGYGIDERVYGKDFKCLSVQTEYKEFIPFLQNNTTGRSVMLLRSEHFQTLRSQDVSRWTNTITDLLDANYMHRLCRVQWDRPWQHVGTASSVFLVRGEDLIHGQYSEWSSKWWTARRSMVFAKHLRDVGDKFRRKQLDSTDEKDKTVLEDSWTKMKRDHGDALGGPYVAVHIRRRDFLSGHRDDIPSLKGAADQIEKAMLNNNLTTAFIATDAPQDEFDVIVKHLKAYKVVKFTPTSKQLNEYMDGGVAIIDQWIAAHARYFMGTSVSTFTFRIHEEREILGFSQNMTYNRFCADQKIGECEQPSKWSIQY